MTAKRYAPADGHSPSVNKQSSTAQVCDACPVQRQTYGYLLSRKASPPLDRYQTILLDDRGIYIVCANNFSKVVESGRAGDRTHDLLSHESNALTTTSPGFSYTSYDHYT